MAEYTLLRGRRLDWAVAFISAATLPLGAAERIKLDPRSVRGRRQELTGPGSVARSDHPNQGARLQAVFLRLVTSR